MVCVANATGHSKCFIFTEASLSVASRLLSLSYLQNMTELLLVQDRLPKYYKERRIFRSREYRKLFRFEKENVEWIANHFLGTSVETRGGALSTVQQMEIFLRSLGDPGFQIGVASDIGVHQSTVSKRINYVIDKILDKIHIWIRFPQTADEIERAQEGWQIPNIVGAIDCVHIRIIKPTVQGQEYFNRKGFCSINVQATCSRTERFTCVDASWPCTVHDSRIWKNSDVFNVMTDNIYNVSLLEDEGYCLAPWLLTPYRRALTVAERNYNRWYTNNRVIERCFGQLKRRFPMMHYTVRFKTNRVCRYIVCAFVLHNIAKHLNNPDDDFDELPIEQDFVYIQNEEDHNVIRRKGVHRRIAIAMELLRLREHR